MSKLRGHGKESCENVDQERGRHTREGKIRKWESPGREKNPVNYGLECLDQLKWILPFPIYLSKQQSRVLTLSFGTLFNC